MCQAQCHHRVSNMMGKKSLVDEQIKGVHWKGH